MRMPSSSAPQLLQSLAPLQCRGSELDEAAERLPAIGVKPDMVVEWPLAPWRGGSGEIERPQPRRAERRADELDHVRVGLLSLSGDRHAERGDVAARVFERCQHLPDRFGLNGRKVPLHVDDPLHLALRVEPGQRLEDAVGARLMIARRHHRLMASRDHGVEDRRIVGGDDRAADLGAGGPLGDAHHHRLARDIGERLFRQPGGCEACGDENDDRHDGALTRFLMPFQACGDPWGVTKGLGGAASYRYCLESAKDLGSAAFLGLQSGGSGRLSPQ